MRGYYHIHKLWLVYPNLNNSWIISTFSRNTSFIKMVSKGKIWKTFCTTSHEGLLEAVYHHASEVNVIFCCDSPNHKSTGLKIFHFCQISCPIFPIFILGLLGHPSNEVLFYLWKNVHLSRITFRSNLVKSLRSHWSLHPFHRPF